MSRGGSVGSIRTNSTVSMASAPRDSNIPALQPSYASSQFVLQAQGSSILCLQHDSLAAERRFVRHKEDVTIISVDNISDVIATRVVSVDKSKTAIVWDIDSGDVLSQYEAYEDILVATWMKNGNLVFGDSLGNLILFNPENADAITARSIFDPLCAIAPTADCRAFALGYNNGSVLIAALSPAFTILHTLTTTSMQPSTITALAWHASSSKQKSDMLAVQTKDGDLRVWSVPKSLEGDESARVVRVLKRPEASGRGNNWLGWSRNGRIVQYSAGTATLWDVRTKNVTWEDVPIPNNVVGICIYGPHGSLFTSSKDHTVQQYMLYPPRLVANIHHAPPLLPPSPPVDLNGGNNEAAVVVVPNHPQDDYSITVMPPMGHSIHEPECLEPMEHHNEGLGIINVVGQRPSSTSSKGSRGSMEGRRNRSTSVSRGGTPAPAPTPTPAPAYAPAPAPLEYAPIPASGPGLDRKISVGSIEQYSISPPQGRKASVASVEPREQYSSAAPGRKGSVGSIEPREQYSASPAPGRRPSLTGRKTHPLRQEIHISPDTPQIHNAVVPSPLAVATDIFANLRERLNSVTYESPRVGGPQNKLSEDDHRKEMLFCIFGWQGDIEDLIGDELESVNARSLNSLVLRMWLGDLDQNSLAVMLGADFTISGDWLFLALSAMGGQNSWTHVARAFVLKLLQKGDIHTAVLCLLAIGDKNDAVEIYISHSLYLEAVLLTCLLWKKDWKRISALVRQWGQYASDSYDGTLAARCFACSDTDAPTAPAPDQRPQRSRTPSIGHARSRSDNDGSNSLARKLSISSPSNPRTTLKMTAKNSPLKLITDFPAPVETKDPIQRSQTTSPSNSIIAGVNRFFYGASGPSRSATSTPIAMSALTPVDPFWAGRDNFPTTRVNNANSKLTPVTEASPLDRTPIQRFGQQSMGQPAMAPAPPPPPPPPPHSRSISTPIITRNSEGFFESKSVTLGDFNKMERAPTPPQNRKPSITLSPPNPGPMNRMPTPALRVASPPPDPIVRAQSSASLRINKPTGLQIQFPPMDVILREGTPPIAGHRRTGSRPSPPIPAGRFQRKESTDVEILDLIEKGNKRFDDQRAAPRHRRGSPERTRRVSPERTYPRKMSVEREPRGRTAEVKRSHMRSPSSPLPSSPQAALYKDEPIYVEIIPQDPIPQFNMPRYDEPRSRSAARGHPRARSPSPASPEQGRDDYKDERNYTSPRQGSRRPSPSRNRSRGRGRVKEIKASHMRSPSSPLPFTPQAQLYQEMSDEVDRQHEEDEYHRQSRRTAQSHTRGRQRMDSRTRGPQPQFQGLGLRHSKSERTLLQWSDNLEHGDLGAGDNYSFNRGVSPAPSSLSRHLSNRGLPSNPRAWRAELQANSRGNSPAPSRGRSPPRSMSAAPTPRGMEGHMAPGPRMMSPPPRAMERLISPGPGQRLMSPPPPSHRTMSPPIGVGRTMSPAPVHRGLTPAPFESAARPPVTLGSLSKASSPVPSPYESIPPPPPPPPPLPAMAMAPAPAEYESIQDLLPAMAMSPPEAPYESIPMARSQQQQLRAKTPAPAPPPPQQYRSMTPGPQYNRSASTTPAQPQYRSMTPGPKPSQFSSRTPAPVPRAASRGRGRSRSRGRDDNPRNQYYGSPSNNEYDKPPPLTTVARSNSHTRNSELTFKPLIRKLPPMPLSPQPLPNDLPVHSALQMHLEPGNPHARDRSTRRVNRSIDLTPESDYGWDRGGANRNGDQRDGNGEYEYYGQEYQGQYSNPEAYYDEMNQMEEEMRARRAMSPAPTLRGAGGVGMI